MSERYDLATRIEAASRTLIGIVRGAEQNERARSEQAELSVDITLRGGGTETWKITIERTASSH